MITLCSCGAIAYGAVSQKRGSSFKKIKYMCSKCFKTFWEDENVHWD